VEHAGSNTAKAAGTRRAKAVKGVESFIMFHRAVGAEGDGFLIKMDQ